MGSVARLPEAYYTKWHAAGVMQGRTGILKEKARTKGRRGSVDFFEETEKLTGCPLGSRSARRPRKEQKEVSCRRDVRESRGAEGRK